MEDLDWDAVFREAALTGAPLAPTPLTTAMLHAAVERLFALEDVCPGGLSLQFKPFSRARFNAVRPRSPKGRRRYKMQQIRRRRTQWRQQRRQGVV